VKATSKLVELMTRYENITEYLSKISDMEHEGDEFVDKLFSIIDQSFVTPLDREDISKLTSSLNEILDYTHDNDYQQPYQQQVYWPGGGFGPGGLGGQYWGVG
jgi:uncharacterized protein Yka (UPF0111/DUF47 family)